MKLAPVIIFLFIVSVNTLAKAENATIATASNFMLPMKEIKKAFEKNSDHSVKVTYGSSGLIFAQIKNGAPFDVFMSADQLKPEQLETEGLSVPNTRFTFATGRLVLWSANNRLIESEGNRLKRGNFKRLAIANPRFAPYGQAALEVLKSLKLSASRTNRLIYGNNISQTYQFVASGNAEIGLVAYSQVFSNNKLKSGSAWIIPASLYSPIKQDVVLTLKGKNNNAAKAFLKFLKSRQAEEIIKAYGYTITDR